MKTIKFRAWNPRNKTMEFFDLLKIYWRGEDTGEYSFPEDWIVMQFTGLKDKNGKEIYEGDVVRYLEGEQDNDKFYEKTDKIYYRNGAFCLNWRTLHGWTTDDNNYMLWDKYRTAGAVVIGDLYYERKDIEVIGNLYENPDLL